MNDFVTSLRELWTGWQETKSLMSFQTNWKDPLLPTLYVDGVTTCSSVIIQLLQCSSVISLLLSVPVSLFFSCSCSFESIVNNAEFHEGRGPIQPTRQISSFQMGTLEGLAASLHRGGEYPGGNAETGHVTAYGWP
ncbi:hypothetical protein BLOT_001310 [Blomia tropicalis]|nr:hypothetical protein BLOT_001310 [Blomia tropicalis]